MQVKQMTTYVVLLMTNRNKWGRYIDGVPIVGGRDDILLNVEKYKNRKIFLAIPSATARNNAVIF